MSKFYITTAISYLNGLPHLGHALEFVQADCIARFKRVYGNDVFFLTGTDEHGVKVYEKALEEGMDPQVFVDKMAEKFIEVNKELNVSYDDFIRTSSERHKKVAKEIWEKIQAKGDIYLDKYEGRYCKGCEAFLNERDIVDGKCVIHKIDLKKVNEENYFFRLSKYSDEIKRLIENDYLKVIPESRKNEMLAIIGEEGLKDISFSRPKKVLPWGIDVPNDDAHVMYVWCDALSNYISAIGLDSDKWPCDVHWIGKDILRFHAGIWIGMLLSAEIPLPKMIAVHGFVSSEGEKMSKSLGNVVSPFEYSEKYGTDYLRYYLLREIPTLNDGDFSHKRFMDLINSELANNIGNLFNRVLMMTERYVGKIPEQSYDEDFFDLLNTYHKKHLEFFENYDLKKACEVSLELSDYANKLIDEKKPWVMSKELEKKDELEKFLYNLLELMSLISHMLYPFIPESAEKMVKSLNIDSKFLLKKYKNGVLSVGEKVVSGEILFVRIEE